MTLWLSGCGGGESGKTAADSRVKVTTTIGMIASAVEVIAGDRVTLASLMGPGVDPHLYKATKGDVDRLESADLILYNGLFLEAKMTEILEKMSRGKHVVAVSESIDDSLLLRAQTAQGHPDPHVWFDVALWSNSVTSAIDALTKEDPQNAEYFRTRGAAYLDTLRALDEWVRQEIATIPKERRVLVTAHDAFNYFGRAYDIEVEGLQGISTVSEAGLYDVTKMVDMLVARGIKAVFVESSVPRKSIEAVVQGCRGKGHDVVIGGELFSDAMGEAGTPEGTYVGMVRHNVRTIVEALR
jgi:manganese/zinc/iron transport system substrate-binding protein